VCVVSECDREVSIMGRPRSIVAVAPWCVCVCVCVRARARVQIYI
jgi:hypothetical protein